MEKPPDVQVQLEQVDEIWYATVTVSDGRMFGVPMPEGYNPTEDKGRNAVQIIADELSRMDELEDMNH